jgi:hypothetical protein
LHDVSPCGSVFYWCFIEQPFSGSAQARPDTASGNGAANLRAQNDIAVKITGALFAGNGEWSQM